MFNLDHKKIGCYLSELINQKFPSQRKFCIEYLKLNNIQDAGDDEISRMANRISQIIKGSKSVQVYDLPIFSKLLEVTFEEILSAGECFSPNSNRLTNYNVALSKDENIWKEYICCNNAILYADEYNKTIIDYALEFKNSALLKYLMDNKYIWFVHPNDKSLYCYNFGAGTSIKRKEHYPTEAFTEQIFNDYSLRQRMICLAAENNDLDMLKELRAREIPSLYIANLNFFTPECSKYYDEEMVIKISKSDEKILSYFSEEFEITDRFENTYKYIFPYISELLDLLITDNSNYAKEMLKRAVKHNKCTLTAIKESFTSTVNMEINRTESMLKSESSLYNRIYKDYIVQIENDAIKHATNHINFSADGNIICYRDILNNVGFLTNIIHVSKQSENEELSQLIDGLNTLYNKIRNFNYGIYLEV